MGADMEELHGRTVHADGEIVLLPLFFLPGVVLVPGQTLPLHLFHPQVCFFTLKMCYLFVYVCYVNHLSPANL